MSKFEGYERETAVRIVGQLCREVTFLRDAEVVAAQDRLAWQLARTTVDHGCCVFERVAARGSATAVRDVAATAIFRRALVTGEAVRLLLGQALWEPAVATLRTLAELERNLRLVLGDPSGTVARRLLASTAVTGRRRFPQALRDRVTRERIQASSRHWKWFRSKARSFSDYVESAVPEALRKEITTTAHWHGYETEAKAFEEAGMRKCYHLLYEGASLFVHATNIERDVRADRMRPMPLAEGNSERDLPYLADLIRCLHRIYELILDDKGRPEYQTAVKVVHDDGSSHEVYPLDGLAYCTYVVFGPAQ
ncbi:DUF5677 domain-containing protein [Candidatus Palauibacter sp.]|uniref:DUF5677 domain-containing protein n=1 Tax=Candidatus Palauibacter sp. TaxID=3101350 RepID=UPI003C7029E8